LDYFEVPLARELGFTRGVYSRLTLGAGGNRLRTSVKG